VRLFVQAAAEADILGQVEWYAARGLSDVARRFYVEAVGAIDALSAMPNAGVATHLRSAQLAGLRSWSVGGFDDFRVYYLVDAEKLIVLRVLHGKRDIGGILEGERLAVK
jgi:plasmid stabilization system protein ParE